MSDSREIIDKIIAIELQMFLAVPSDGQGNCQDNPQAFSLHRRAQFSIWSEAALVSFYQDLVGAQNEGVNLMTIKYAFIQGLIPGQNDSPFLDKVLQVQLDWQKEMLENHPTFKGKARPLEGDDDERQLVSFKNYARGELETYSAKTLQILHADFQEMRNRGINGSREIYSYLINNQNQHTPRKTID